MIYLRNELKIDMKDRCFIKHFYLHVYTTMDEKTLHMTVAKKSLGQYRKIFDILGHSTRPFISGVTVLNVYYAP